MTLCVKGTHVFEPYNSVTQIAVTDELILNQKYFSLFTIQRIDFNTQHTLRGYKFSLTH